VGDLDEEKLEEKAGLLKGQTLCPNPKGPFLGRERRTTIHWETNLRAISKGTNNQKGSWGMGTYDSEFLLLIERRKRARVTESKCRRC